MSIAGITTAMLFGFQQQTDTMASQNTLSPQLPPTTNDGTIDWNLVCGVLAILGALIASLRYLFRKHLTRRSLSRIYTNALKELTLADNDRRALLEIVTDREFFRSYALPVSVSCRAEKAQILVMLQRRQITIGDDIIEKFLNKVEDGCSFAEESCWQEKAKQWRIERTAAHAPAALQPVGQEVYWGIVALDPQKSPEEVARQMKAFFESIRFDGGLRQLNASSSHSQILVVNSQDLFNSTRCWQSTLQQSCAALRSMNTNREIVHLALAGPSLLFFAIGTVLNNRCHNLILYHYQGTYNRIWRIDRTIKNACAPQGDAPRATQNSLHVVFHEGTDRTAEVIALSFGRTDLELVLPQWLRGQDLFRNLPLRILQLNNRQGFPVDAPQVWLNAASETVSLISNSAATNIYLFADAPAVFNLMIGDALGHYRTIHLMQFLPEARSYSQVLVLPRDIPVGEVKESLP